MRETSTKAWNILDKEFNNKRLVGEKLKSYKPSGKNDPDHAEELELNFKKPPVILKIITW